jgi:hypothetical protein
MRVARRSGPVREGVETSLPRRSDTERVTALLIAGSIFTAVGLAVCTDALHRRVQDNDRASWLLSRNFKWRELLLGIGLVGMGVILIASALTS